MATLVLSTLGAALGGPFGRVLGGVAGNIIDRRLFGEDIEGPRLGDVSISTAEEGTAIPRAYGTVRTGGHLIWATRFEEEANVERQGAKGRAPTTTTYSYAGNAAYALCEGPISMVRRIWADGKELDLTEIEYRVHLGTETQLPDPLIAAKQGGTAPAYRGTAYVVFERLPLERFGNRLPQFSFEVVRGVNPVARATRAITIIPGATEFGYATTPVIEGGDGEARALNRHVLHARTDWQAALDELTALCPNLRAVSLVVSWFGDDLDAARCLIRPGVETPKRPGINRSWNVAGYTRGTARPLSQLGASPAYGGTPDDESVIEAIRDLRARGLEVFLYPFVLMDVPPDNDLTDPYGAAEQAAYPWRGRITCSPAPGRPESPDGSDAARAAVEAFVGDEAKPNYAAFVEHCVSLCERAGGVDGFVIGSEMRGLTMIRDADDTFPFVEALANIARTAKDRLGPGTAITYAADWSEYFGHQPADGSGDVFFHLDPLWADPAIDAVGIDNYMPLSDLRDEDRRDGGPDGLYSAADAAGLSGFIDAGERFDWYYASEADREARIRTPITDGAHGKPWVFRPKDIRAWWSEPHFERRGGVELGEPTSWVPASKPVWLTELGAPAVDKAANQPNVFPDPKSSESAYPHFSNGVRDDHAQHAFLEAHLDHWRERGEEIVPLDRIFLWTWDARPIPAFPVLEEVWSDGGNWRTGHWLNGRFSGAPLGEVLSAVLSDHGFEAYDTSAVEGWASGLLLPDPADARTSIRSLLESHGVDASERDGRIVFSSRTRRTNGPASIERWAIPSGSPERELTRSRGADLPTEAVLAYRDPMRSHEVASQRAVLPAAAIARREARATPLTLEADEAANVIDALLRERHEARDRLTIEVPWAQVGLRPGDLVQVPGLEPMLVEGITDGLTRRLELSVAPDPTRPRVEAPRSAPPASPTILAGKPLALLLDLPLLPEREAGAFVAARQRPWRPLVVLRSRGRVTGTAGTLESPSLIGRLVEPLSAGPIGAFDDAHVIELTLPGGALESRSVTDVLSGGNAIAVRSPLGWEILQFAMAEEVAPERWRLRHLLRGRLGTERAMGAPAGADAVLLGAPLLPLPVSARESELAPEWIVTPAGVALDPERSVVLTGAVGAEALTPLSPAHLRVEAGPEGALHIGWVRRARVDADSWLPDDIPLGEEREAYRVRIEGADRAASFETAEPRFTYEAALREANGHAQGPLVVSVAQIGTLVGEGHRATVILEGERA